MVYLQTKKNADPAYIDGSFLCPVSAVLSRLATDVEFAPQSVPISRADKPE
jgi:hypothetical protein